MILGKTGSGKTHLSKRLLEAHRRVFIVDTVHEYPGLISYSFDDLAENYASVNGSPFILTLRPEDPLDVEYLFRLAWVARECCVVLEEADQWVSSTSMSADLSRLISLGRHRKISLIAIARVVPEVPIQLRRQFTEFYSFRQSEPRDLELLSSYGFDSEALAQLPDHEYLSIRQ